MQDRLFTGIEQFAHDIALIGLNGEPINYREFLGLADDAVASLASQRTLILCEMANEIAPIAFYIGALRAGHVVIPVNAGALADDIANTFTPGARFSKRGESWTLEKSDNISPMHPDLAILLSTSGSTGSPKLVRLSHSNLVSNAQAIAEYLRFEPGERAITSLPPHYSFGLSVIHSHLHCGHCIVLNGYSVADEEFWETILRERVTSFAGVPHSFDLIGRAGFLKRDHPSLRYFTQAGGKLAEEKVREIAILAQNRGKRFYVMYGQTEAAPRMAFLPPEHAIEHANTIGRAIPGGSFRLEPIADPDQAESDCGELVYRGPNVMMGYAHTPADLIRPQGSNELRTGDLALRESTGYYRIVGRISRFAKLFGLRLSYDEIEARLEAGGTVAAVSGDDSGIVVAAIAPTDTAAVAAALSRHLGIPQSLIAVAEVDNFPRLPTGKIDYRAIRDLRQQAVGAAASALPRKQLAPAIAEILGRASIDPSQSFASLGGDSLTYIQASLAIEDLLGYMPADWENLPIQAIERMPQKGERNNGQLSMLGYDAARSVAITLALFAHCSVQANASLRPTGDFLASLATPTLIILFGIMIALLHMSKMTTGGLAKSFEGHIKMSLQCYSLFALNVFAFWLTEPTGWKYCLITLAMLGSMPYAQILSFYSIMFLFLPVIMIVLKKFNFYSIFFGALTVHFGFLALKGVPSPPEIGGQPMIQRVLDLLVGTGSHPIISGPSLIHSLVLVLAGYRIGMAVRNSSAESNWFRAFAVLQLPVLIVFATMALWSTFIPGYPVTFDGLSNLQLRNLNHPAYIFITGGLSLLILDAILVMPWTRHIPSWFMTPGRNSLFAFGFGNAFILLWPHGGFATLSPLSNTFLIFAAVMALVYAYDFCIRSGAAGHGVPALVYRLSQFGEQATRRGSEWIVRTVSRWLPPSFSNAAERHLYN